MKIGVLMNIYNEIEWAESAIQSVLDWCDEMVIVEGAYQIAIEAGAPPRSNDGTLKILDKYRDNPKITIIHSNEKDEAPQLQNGLEQLKKKKVDWYLLVDGDEVWRKQDLNIIKKFINKGDKQGIYQYRVHFTNFINSFDKYYDSIMKRVFKITPGAVTVGQNGVAWPDHNKACDDGSKVSQPWISTIADIVKCFHYTEIKSAERWLLKKSYLKIRDGNPRFDVWKVTEDGFVNDEKNIKKFIGKHPDVVKQTNLYRIWEKDPSLLKEKLFSNYSEAEYSAYIKTQEVDEILDTEHNGKGKDNIYKYCDLLMSQLTDFDIKDKRILDIGCREFFTYDYFLEKFDKTIEGADVGSDGLEYTKKENKPAVYLDAHKLDSKYDNDTLDMIVTFHALEHMYDIDLVLEKCYNALKYGGYLYVAVPVPCKADMRGHWQNLPNVEYVENLCKKSRFNILYSKYLQNNEIRNEKELILLLKKD